MELHEIYANISKLCQSLSRLLVYWHPTKRAIILFISAAGSTRNASQHVSINWDRRWSEEKQESPHKVSVQLAVNVIQWTPIKVK